jgi:hypothetical protein
VGAGPADALAPARPVACCRSSARGRGANPARPSAIRCQASAIEVHVSANSRSIAIPAISLRQIVVQSVSALLSDVSAVFSLHCTIHRFRSRLQAASTPGLSQRRVLAHVEGKPITE